ncbi:hypothetical protein ACFXHA_11050 [Nocardia sp. NPDC059240]|uniref:hypothetical protein n=1 Tax=Nocardia sp. NPDC059240 TaxID=3346786 RepID=UPI0036AA559A
MSDTSASKWRWLFGGIVVIGIGVALLVFGYMIGHQDPVCAGSAMKAGDTCLQGNHASSASDMHAQNSHGSIVWYIIGVIVILLGLIGPAVAGLEALEQKQSDDQHQAG